MFADDAGGANHRPTAAVTTTPAILNAKKNTVPHITFWPLMMRMRATITATTSKTWMNPFNVYADTIPNSQSKIRTVAKVYSIMSNLLSKAFYE
jgi:hypothetical protein